MEILDSEHNDLDFLAFDLDWQRSNYKTNQNFENLFSTMSEESHASHRIENNNFESFNYFDNLFEDLDDDSMELLPGSLISDNTIFTASTQDFLSGSDLTNTEFYSSNRWFEEAESSKNGGTRNVNDPAKLKCHTCHVRAELKWIDGHFRLYDQSARVGKSY